MSLNFYTTVMRVVLSISDNDEIRKDGCVDGLRMKELLLLSLTLLFIYIAPILKGSCGDSGCIAKTILRYDCCFFVQALEER